MITFTITRITARNRQPKTQNWNRCSIWHGYVMYRRFLMPYAPVARIATMKMIQETEENVYMLIAPVFVAVGGRMAVGLRNF